MTRNLRPLGLAFLAILAISAAAAPVASAESFIFRSDAEEETTLGGEQEGSEKKVLTTTAGTVKCEKVTYTGTQIGSEASSVELAPTYTGCTLGTASAEINANGCKYRFKTGTTESSKFEGTVDIVCPEGKQIVTTAKLAGTTKCTVDLPAQTGLKSITFTNVGSEDTDVTADVNLSGVKYTQTAGTGLGACTGTTDENGSREGNDLITAEAEGEAIGFASDRIGTWMTITPARLDFEKDAKGSITEFKIYNGHSIVRYIEKLTIVNSLEVVEEKHFKYIPGSSTCKVKGSLNSTEECTVAVEFVSGTLKQIAWLRLQWGGYWPWSETHVRKADIVS
jgi:hypothetical protein